MRLVRTLRPDGLVVVSDGRITGGSSLAAVAAGWRTRDLQVAALACGGEVERDRCGRFVPVGSNPDFDEVARLQ